MHAPFFLCELGIFCKSVNYHSIPRHSRGWFGVRCWRLSRRALWVSSVSVCPSCCHQRQADRKMRDPCVLGVDCWWWNGANGSKSCDRRIEEWGEDGVAGVAALIPSRKACLIYPSSSIAVHRSHSCFCQLSWKLLLSFVALTLCRPLLIVQNNCSFSQQVFS
jgi:hypothetical protein